VMKCWRTKRGVVQAFSSYKAISQLSCWKDYTLNSRDFVNSLRYFGEGINDVL